MFNRYGVTLEFRDGRARACLRFTDKRKADDFFLYASGNEDLNAKVYMEDWLHPRRMIPETIAISVGAARQ